MSAKLSVIVPVYNSERYLAGTLDSLLNQTLHDIDIICVDDGSTDNCPEILKQYAARDKRIRIITQKNAGQATARNAGLKLVNTEFITFVDSDDRLVPNAYEIAMSKMTDGIDFVHFGIRVIGANDESRQRADDDYYTIKFNGRVRIDEHVINNSDVSPCNKIFRKSILDKYKIRFPDGLHYEDAYFCNVYEINSKYGFYIPDKLYEYLRHDGSIMAQTFTNTPGFSIDHLKIAIKLYEYLSENKLLKLWEHHFAHCFFSYFDFAIQFEHNESRINETYDMAINFLDKNNLSFAHFNDFRIIERTLRQRQWGHNTQKYMFGLLRKKTNGQNVRYLFCGIPLMRIKYCADKTRYYPMASFCLYERKIKNKKKILFLMNHIIMGGVEKVLLQYLDILCANGYECTVLSRDKVSDRYFLDFFITHNVKFDELNKTKQHFFLWKKIANLLRTLKLYRFVRANDVIVDFANFCFSNKLKGIKKCKIGYCHGSILFFKMAIDKNVFTEYDGIVLLSDTCRSEVIKAHPQYANKIHRIYNPINVQSVIDLSMEKVDVKPPYFVAVQRLDSSDKDVATIINAFNIFSKTHPRYSLYIIGNGPQRTELEHMAKSNKHIIFTGNVNNPYPCIRNARALILSSTTTIGEGLPNVLLEAQSLGTLAISSDVPSGPREILMNGKAGLLFKPGNHKELAKILTDIADKKYDIAKITLTATKNLSRFNAENNVNRFLDLIQDCI